MSHFNKALFSLVLILSVLYLPACAQNKNENLGEDDMSDGPNPIAVLETNKGDIHVKLFCDKTPKTCENFIGLMEKDYYNGTIFHRVIPNFMIQGGDPTGTGRGGESIWGGKFKDEVTPSLTFNKTGLLAMANAGPNTNGSQFFITTAETPWLNMKHTIFGEIVSGYSVVLDISGTPTAAGDKPIEEQKIIKAYIKE